MNLQILGISSRLLSPLSEKSISFSDSSKLRCFVGILLLLDSFDSLTQLPLPFRHDLDSVISLIHKNCKLLEEQKKREIFKILSIGDFKNFKIHKIFKKTW